jgi:outer membrane protein TolC
VKARQEEEKALFNLNSFLGFENDSTYYHQYPACCNMIYQFNPDNAIEIAKNNNPSILEIEQKKLEADKTLDKAIKESRFSASLVASYGLNQYAEKLPDAYKKPTRPTDSCNRPANTHS